MSNQSHPFADRDPRVLSDGEWRVLQDYRLAAVEKRLDSLFKLFGLIAVGLIVGVVSFWLTAGGPGP